MLVDKTGFPLPTYLFILIEALVVGYGDLKWRKIPNFWSILNVTLFIGFLFLFPEIYKLSWQHFIIPIAIIILGIFLFSQKLMGGGDSKFMASIFLLLPISIHFNFLQTLLISIICVVIFSIIYRFIRLKKYNEAMNLFKHKIPFAPILALAWLIWGVVAYV